MHLRCMERPIGQAASTPPTVLESHKRIWLYHVDMHIDKLVEPSLEILGNYICTKPSPSWFFSGSLLTILAWVRIDSGVYSISRIVAARLSRPWDGFSVTVTVGNGGLLTSTRLYKRLFTLYLLQVIHGITVLSSGFW